MNTDEGPPPKNEVRPLTQQLILSSLFDTWPGNAAVMDFGIDSDRHLGALHHAIRHEEVTAEELDAAMGNGEKLTEIAQRGSNPYRDVSFRTAWDDMPMEPVAPASPSKEPLPLDPEIDRVVTELEKSWQAPPERPSYDDFLNEAIEKALSRMEGKGRDR